jgi:hypothetical protein
MPADDHEHLVDYNIPVACLARCSPTILKAYHILRAACRHDGSKWPMSFVPIGFGLFKI